MAELDIIGGIGMWPNTKERFNDFFKQNEGEDIVLNISSLGGDVDTGLFANQALRKHTGKTTVNLSGFIASSATIISSGADVVNIAAGSFYLIHKVMNFVDVFGMLNADDIEETIRSLEKNKAENVKMDAEVVQIYKRKTGKPESEIMELMKEDTFITAKEALEFGFVDNIINDEQMGLTNEVMFKMVASADVPKEMRKKMNARIKARTNMSENKDQNFVDKITGAIDEKLNSFLSKINKREDAQKTEETVRQEAQKENEAEDKKFNEALEAKVNEISSEFEGKFNELSARVEEAEKHNEDLKKENSELAAKLAKATASETKVEENEESGLDTNKVNKGSEFFNAMVSDIKKRYK